MRIKCKVFSVIYKIMLALLAFVGVFILLLDSGWINFRMFTILTNTACALYFLILAFKIIFDKKNDGGKIRWPILKGALMLSVSLVGGVSAVLYTNMINFSTANGIAIFLVHVVAPIMTILDWLLFDKKGKFNKFSPLWWTLPPIIYAIFIFISAQFMNPDSTLRFPYIFFNYPEIGILPCVLWCLLIIILYLTAGYLCVFIDKKMSKKPRKVL